MAKTKIVVAKGASRLPQAARAMRVLAKRRARPVLRFFNSEAVALSLCVWFFIELVLVLWKHDLHDYISHFVDPSLLVAQFVASVLLFFTALFFAFKEGRNPNGSTISKRNYDNLRLIKEEAVKVPIFFASAMFISGLAQAFDSLVAMDRNHSFAHWATNLWPAVSWLLFAISLYAFAGVVNRALK